MSFESALAKLRESFGAYMKDNVLSKVQSIAQLRDRFFLSK